MGSHKITNLNFTNILFLLHAKYDNEIALDWNVKIDYELIADNGKHARAMNDINEDSSCVNNVFLTVALRSLQQSKPTHLNYKAIYGNVDDAKARTKRQ